jgi:hypothetical protein
MLTLALPSNRLNIFAEWLQLPLLPTQNATRRDAVKVFDRVGRVGG